MGVYVLGMHRSGTSAVTRVINLLGVPIGRADRLMPVQADNPAGFWEHLALMEVNDEVLDRLGGSWDAPPAPDPSFVDAPEMAELLARAGAEFVATYDGPRWVFKDPRASVVLPFWRRCVGSGDDVAVVVVRNPLDIAASLSRRDRMAVTYAMALWERYTRLVFRDAAGLPAIVVDYDRIVDDPAAVTDLEKFLVAHDQVATAPDPDAIRRFLLSSLRHARHDRAALDRDERVSAEQRALFDRSLALAGAHERFDPGELPPDSPLTDALITARRAPTTAERRALDRATRLTGECEYELEACRAELGTARAVSDAVAGALGYTEIGRLERAALGAARRARRAQQMLRRR